MPIALQSVKERGVPMVACFSPLLRGFLCATLMTGVLAFADQVQAKKQWKRYRRPSAVLYQIRHDAGPEQLEALKAVAVEYGLKFDKDILSGRIKRARGPQQLAGYEELLADAIRATNAVAFAEPDYLVELSSVPIDPAQIPNDPSYSMQWHLAKIGLPGAWDVTTGSRNVKVVLCDTGVQADHPDLKANLVLPGFNTVDNTTNIVDSHGHGTTTAGVLGAVGSNGIGVSGAAWNISVLPVRVSNLADGAAYYSDMAECIRWGADRGAKVANLSYEVGASDTIEQAAAYMRSKGGLLITSSGNAGADTSVTTPSYSSFLVVGSTGREDQLSGFSNYGEGLDLVAPGEAISTTAIGSGYQTNYGTSYSAPLTAGVAALLYSLNPSFTAAQVESFIVSSAVDLGAVGRDNQFGAGRLNAAGAVQKALLTDAVPPSISFTNPSNNAKLSKYLNIQVNATDNMSVSAVEFYVDNEKIATDASAPYSYVWNTSLQGNGAHTIMAKAIDRNNNSRSVSVQVNVQNTVTMALLDNAAAGVQDSAGGRTFTGRWCKSSNAGFYGVDSLYSCGVGLDTYRFTPRLKTARYDVYVRWTAGSSRSDRVPITVRHKDGTTTKQVNMRSYNGIWILHGRYDFVEGTSGSVEISDVNGEASVDAVRFVPVY